MGFKDGYEIEHSHTDPHLFDTDGDGLVDGIDPHPLASDGDCYGQSAAWVAATFTNAAEILSVGYTNWVCNQVGSECTNGYYKFTVTFANAPEHPLRLSVGDKAVVVDEAGDYVFLLAVWSRYSISMSFVPEGVSYSWSEDLPLSASGNGVQRRLRASRGLGSSPYDVFVESTGMDGCVDFSAPSMLNNGWIAVRGILSLSPGYYVNPPLPITFTTSILGVDGVSVHWSSGEDGLVDCDGDMLTLDSLDGISVISVTATSEAGTATGTITITRSVHESQIMLRSPGAFITEASYIDQYGNLVQTTSATSLVMTAEWMVASEGTLRLCGSPSGGVTVRNGSGDAVSLPYEWSVSEDDVGSAEFAVETGDSLPPGSLGTFTLEYLPCEGNSMSSETSITHYEIKVEADAAWPTNRVRHVFGPLEYVTFRVIPDDGFMSWRLGSRVHNSPTWELVMQNCPCQQSASLDIGGANYQFDLSVIAPMGYGVVSADVAVTNDWLAHGCALPDPTDISVGLVVSNSVLPDYVSFDKVYLCEGTCGASNGTGSFQGLESILPSHDISAGALVEMDVSQRNEVCQDLAAATFSTNGFSSISGSVDYAITNFWYCKNGLNAFIKHPFCVTMQRVEVGVDHSLSVSKFGCTATRPLNGTNTLTRSN